jgi:hypothetical protein
VEDFIESTCGAKIAHPHLVVGVGMSSRILNILSSLCVMNNCADCDVEKKILLSTCGILATYTNEVSVIECVLSEQQDVNKNTDTYNVQLELSVSTLAVADVVKNDIPARHMLNTPV